MPRRLLCSLVLAAALCALGGAQAAASTDLGQVCFVFVGFPDTIRLTATLPGGSATIADLHFRWRGPNYQVLGSGTAASNVADPAAKVDIVLVGAHNTAQFDGQPLCSLYFTMSLSSGGGPVHLSCTGAGGPPFTANAQLQIAPCIGP